MIEPDLALGARLFDELKALGADAGGGITRDTYGPGEQAAHDLMARTAHALGLAVRVDAALNLYLTLPGLDRAAPAVMTGSHLDSVPRGGNYDGAAGVVAGLCVLAGWRAAGAQPRCDVTVMGIRAEESAWFPVSYIGSKAAFGLLGAADLQAPRFDTARPLAAHLQDWGGQPGLLRAGAAALQASRVAAFVELHIEQGPVLLEAGLQAGVVSGICGSLHYRQARATGRYAHSGATPRAHRQDAVVAVAELIAGLQQAWIEMEQQGHELTLTFGQLNTDSRQADFSKVCGRVDFCIDIRSRHPETLRHMDGRVRQAVAAIGAARGVSFDLGPQTGSQPAAMDVSLRRALKAAADAAGVACGEMPSGAGHDSAIFANQGVPTAMLFVRNANGSHNPDEAMDLADFGAATRVMARVLADRAALAPAPGSAT
ncbi:MAG: Allantoate amidohydrolase [Paracidovorax wautersii]|uniref:Allantoate amidohydrolase n=1 Tax=Paracidovorax wautersii TaxID=1177982 RepID=A0A7V8FN61_9BURK|nr:MAG: Allantoate amidohydrolase [Paracidovorax wautersii]